MAINTETVFVDATTVVLAEWLNLIQEHLAGLVQLQIDTPTATQVRILAASDNDAASVYIGGQQRYRDTNTSFTFTSEPADTYDVYVTAPDSVETFELEVTTGTPGEALYRKVAEVVWNGAAITSIRQFAGRNIAHAHTLLDGSGKVSHVDVTDPASGDPHTQYIHKDGSRPFTGVVVGVTPVGDTDLATKGYVDGITVPGLPIGTILPFSGDVLTDLPAGWYLCDGASYDTTAEAALFAVTAYVYGGAASNFNVPLLQEVLPLGKATVGTGWTLGGTGGLWNHHHTQPTHAHTTTAHSHTTATHDHVVPSSNAPSVEHNHAQDAAVAGGAHVHAGSSHQHGSGTLAVGNTGGSSASGGANPGLFAYIDLDQSSDNSSHRHDDGTLGSDFCDILGGLSSYATASHTHVPSGGAYAHTHAQGTFAGSTAVGGTADTDQEADHQHTNPTSSTSTEAHVHTGGTTGAATPSVNSGGGGGTAADGGDDTGTNNPPYIIMNYIIRAS